MSEFLNLVSDRELLNLAAQAEQNKLFDAESLIRDEMNHRRLASLALCQGVYDASQDTYKNPPEAPQEWLVGGQE